VARYDGVHGKAHGPYRQYLERGQVAVTGQFISAKWQWTKDETKSFLARLQKKGLMEVKNKDEIKIVTIMEYDERRPRASDRRSDDPLPGIAKERKLGKTVAIRTEPSNRPGWHFKEHQAA
jgi:hypothetical protein